MTGPVGLEQGVSLGDFNGYELKPLKFDRIEEMLMSSPINWPPRPWRFFSPKAVSISAIGQ